MTSPITTAPPNSDPVNCPKLRLPNGITYRVAKILYIHAMGPYCRIFTEDVEDITTMKFAQMRKQLPHFVQIRRGVWVNPRHIKSYAVQVGGKYMPVSRRHQDIVKGNFAMVDELPEGITAHSQQTP